VSHPSPALLGPRQAQLSPVCTLDIDFGPVPSFPTPVGTRLLFAATGGRAAGPRLNGAVLPGSADWLLVGDDLTARVDVRAVIRTDDGAHLQMTTTGRAVLGQHAPRFLAGETVTAEDAYIRTSPLFATSDERYAHLNNVVALAWCDISLAHIRYRIYAVD
jgi:hypothetical protein